MSHRVTSYEVARLAGVSQSAVSRCFTPGASIAADTREKIQRAANELGYTPNALASGLSRQSSNLIALVIPRVVNIYFPELLAGLGSAITQLGKHTILFTTESETGSQDIARAIVGHAADGVISALTLDHEATTLLKSRQIPVVMLNRDASDPGHATVAADHALGAAAVAELLIEQNASRVALIIGPGYSPTGRKRMQGFCSRITPIASFEGDFSYNSGRHLADAILSAKADAVFCANDAMAMGLIDALRFDHGINIPKDMKIVGFDDLMAAGWPAYDLTTMRQPVDAMVEAARDALIGLAEGRQPMRQLLPCQMIRRSTC